MEDAKEPKHVTAKVGDKFIHSESNTIVGVTKVNKDDGTVDVQEAGGDQRYWGGVAANTDCLKPVK